MVLGRYTSTTATKQQQQQLQTSSTYSACPIDHTKLSTSSACPIKPSNGGDNDDDVEVLNPLNNMPMAISSELAPGQKSNYLQNVPFLPFQEENWKEKDYGNIQVLNRC